MHHKALMEIGFLILLHHLDIWGECILESLLKAKKTFLYTLATVFLSRLLISETGWESWRTFELMKWSPFFLTQLEILSVQLENFV